MMRCRDVDALVSSYLDGELDDARVSALRGHLRGCARCLGQVEDIAAIRDTAARLESIDPPPALWSRIEAGLARAEIADAARSRLWLRWQAVRPMLLPGAVAVCAATVLVLWLVKPGQDRGHDDRASIESAVTDSAVTNSATTDSAMTDSAMTDSAIIDNAHGGSSAGHGDHPIAAGDDFAGAERDHSAAAAGPQGELAGASETLEHLEARARQVLRADRRYLATIAELRQLVAHERRSWPAELAGVFDRRLAAFDARAERQRQTLGAAEAGDAAGRDRLYAVYQAKIEFLQAVVVDGVVADSSAPARGARGGFPR